MRAAFASTELALSLLLAATALFACGETADRAFPPTAKQTAIIGGTPDTGHTGVGVVYIEDVKGVCTGALIAPDQVLTAAHCVYGVSQPKTFVERIVFYFGDAPGPHVRVQAAVVDPGFAGLMERDVAVLWLSSPIADRKPATLSTTAPAMGEQITIVGYGDTGYTGGGFGTRRLGLQKIGEVQDLVFGFESTPAICHGDSGGPSFATRGGEELLIGVHTASSQQCVGWGYDMRVDAFRGWITGAKPQMGFYRAPCGQGYPCASKLCVAAPDGQERCSQECSSGACPYRDACVNGKSPTDPPKVCLPLSGGQAALGDPCGGEHDCLSGKCVDLGAPGGGVCTAACATGKDCPAGFECADRGKGLYCVAVKAADAGAADRGVVDAGVPGDAALPDASSQSTGGGCVVGGRSRATLPAGLACLLIGVLAWRRRRRS